MFRFESWPFLLLLVPVAILGWWWRQRELLGREGFRFPGFLVALVPVSPLERLWQVARWFPLAALVLMVVAAARPQWGHDVQKQHTSGIDIMLCLDLSSSMKALDFKPMNRFQVARETTLAFVEGRPYDRIGFVAFAGYAINRCPLTTDHHILQQIIRDTKLDSIEDGTAIGMAIATATNRLRKSKAKSKVIILLTDGVNNRGAIDPSSAADLAKELGIRLYAIGVGTRGMAEIPQPGPFGTTQLVKVPVEIDEDMLQRITTMTGGAYFRATDPEKLKSIYHIIDQLEKTRIEVKRFTLWRDIYRWPLTAALVLLLMFVLVRDGLLRVKS